MKSKPEHEPTADQKYKAFEDGLSRILMVSKTDLEKAEKEYQDARLPRELRRGPKSKNGV